MWTAINTENGEQIVSISKKWTDKRDVLRDLHLRNCLICDECRQLVNFKGGEIVRWYFSHKQSADCPRDNESAELSLARALLFELLEAEYGNRVSLEKRLEDSGLPRRVDCWVDSEEGGSIAYWIVENQIRSVRERDALQTAFQNLNASVHWLFLSKMEKLFGEASDALILSPTEREFLVSTRFDPEIEGGLYLSGSSIHFLNLQTESLTTYRHLRLFHVPQIFHGRREISPLADVSVSALSGDLYHPHEYEQVNSFREAWDSLQEERRESRLALNSERLIAIQERLRQQRVRQEQERVREEEQERRKLAQQPPSERQWSQNSRSYSAPRVTMPVSDNWIGSPGGFRVTRSEEIAAIMRHRRPRVISYLDLYVNTCLTDEEAVRVCGLFRDERYFLNIYDKVNNTCRLGAISDTELIHAHQMAMEFAKRNGIEAVENTVEGQLKYG